MQETDLIPNDFDYFSYIKRNNLQKILGINNIPENPQKKIFKSITSSVDPQNQVPYSAEFDDLSRLHLIARKRKVSTILEFGVGKSTSILADALLKNKKNNYDYFVKNLRKKNIFEIHSIDNYKKWIDECLNNISSNFIDGGIVNMHFSNLKTGEFSGRVCTYYQNIPNIAPDLIYLDGPDQFSPVGDIRGISTRHQDRFPMSADILSFEHFLHPGTLIIVDGRTANARFLHANFQRSWSYYYSENWDQHFFELLEKPLGKYNKMMIDYCLGKEYYKRLDHHQKS